MIAKFWLNKYNHLDCIIYWTVEKPGTFPYFFGRTDDECIDRVKRAALSPQRLSHKNGNHMWIQYRGIFFEFGVGKSRELKSLRSWWMRKSDRVTSGWLQHSQRGMSGKVCQELLETIRPFQWHVQACPPFR